MDQDFTILYKKYKEPIFSYIYYLSGNRTVAEEICQDIFLKVYLHIGKFEGRSSFKTWIYRIAKNTYIDFAKASSRQVLTCENGQPGEELIDKCANPEEHLLNREVGDNIQKTLSMLSERYRTLIILRDIQNMSYQEISQVTDLKLSNVKVNIYRARKEFQKIYTRLEGN